MSDINWKLFVHGPGDTGARPLWIEERGTSGDLTGFRHRLLCLGTLRWFRRLAEAEPPAHQGSVERRLRADAVGHLHFPDPRSVDVDLARRATWHAKVVVVDDDVSLVTSANFTEWAHQRNVETGALIRSPGFAQRPCQQFQGLIQARAVCEVPGIR